MARLLVLAILVAFVALAAADGTIRAKVASPTLERHSSLTKLSAPVLAKMFKGISKQTDVRGGADECKVCIDFMNEAVNTLIQIIANGGVIGGCSGLCNLAFGNKSEILTGVCDILCTVVGIDEFSNLLSDVDPDPVWLCEELKACDYNDNDAANITSLSVQPTSGRTGTKFNFDIQYDLTVFDGIGSVGVVVFGPGGMADGGGLLFYPQPGTYGASFALDTKPNQYYTWQPGSYEFQIAICEGDCGCIHDHSKVLTVQSLNFTISNKEVMFGKPVQPNLKLRSLARAR